MAEPKETVWKLDPHTSVKHRILGGYLDAWFPIMARRERRLVILDGFAGPGRYRDGSIGSPLLMLRSLVDHDSFNKMNNTEFIFVFVEGRQDRFERLREEVDSFKKRSKPWPANVRVVIRSGAFVDVAKWIIDARLNHRLQPSPTLAFVDPFGISGVPMTILSELLRHGKCELFVNFMIDPTNRFASSDQINHVLDELYGCTRYSEAANYDGAARISFLRNLYTEQLRTVGGFQYVQSFGMRNQTGHVLYDLVFATRHILGLQRMKEAMWKADPSGMFEFSDRTAGQQSMFIGEHLDGAPLRTAVLEKFAGQYVLVKTIEDFTTVKTPFLPQHLRKFVLIPLEKDGVIVVERPGRTGYPPGTKVRLP